MVPPVGLVGNDSMSTLDFGVTTASMAWAVTANPFSALQATGTGTA